MGIAYLAIAQGSQFRRNDPVASLPANTVHQLREDRGAVFLLAMRLHLVLKMYDFLRRGGALSPCGLWDKVPVLLSVPFEDDILH